MFFEKAEEFDTHTTITTSSERIEEEKTEKKPFNRLFLCLLILPLVAAIFIVAAIVVLLVGPESLKETPLVFKLLNNESLGNNTNVTTIGPAANPVLPVALGPNAPAELPNMPPVTSTSPSLGPNAPAELPNIPPVTSTSPSVDIMAGVPTPVQVTTAGIVEPEAMLTELTEIVTLNETGMVIEDNVTNSVNNTDANAEAEPREGEADGGKKAPDEIVGKEDGQKVDEKVPGDTTTGVTTTGVAEAQEGEAKETTTGEAETTTGEESKGRKK